MQIGEGSSAQTITVRWYRTTQSGIDFPHCYWSHNWTEAQDRPWWDTEEPGEDFSALRPWKNGSAPTGLVCTGPKGSASAWAGQSDGLPLFPVRGFPCDSGGVVLGGLGAWPWIGAGGEVLGGLGAWPWIGGDGGEVLGGLGAWPMVGDGGAVLGGDGTWALVGDGGEVLGGEGSWDSDTMPTGAIIDFGASSNPTGWLTCDGSAVSRSTYADLFAVIGTTWGVGDGSTTFNLPDLRGRAAIGDGTGSGLSARTLAGSGGEETHVLTTAELASHTHPASSGTFILTSGAGSGNFLVTGTALATSSVTGSRGSDTAHNTMMPYKVTRKIIKT